MGMWGQTETHPRTQEIQAKCRTGILRAVQENLLKLTPEAIRLKKGPLGTGNKEPKKLGLGITSIFC